jgi:hypothetical protein
MQEKIAKYVQEYEKNAERLAREYKIMKIFSWVSLFLILTVLILFIAKSSFAACPSGQVQDYQGNCVSINQAASEVNNPYSNSGGSSVSGLASYGQKNIQLSCNQTPNFFGVSYTVGSSGDINVSINVSGQSAALGYQISGVCSNGYIVCPAGTWIDNPSGTTCAFYQVAYSQSGGWQFNTVPSIQAQIPTSTPVTSIALNGTTSQVSSVQSPASTTGGLANCICINDSCAQGGSPVSQTEPDQILTDLGGIFTSAITSGSSNEIGASTINDKTSPYSIEYAGGDSTSCNGNSGYSTANNLEGLYSQGGSSLSNEVTNDLVNTANATLQSNFGMSDTPKQMLVNTQIAAFGNANSGGLCQIQNQVSFHSSSSYTNAIFVPSSPVSTNAVGIGMGGGQSCANGSCFSSSTNTIILSTNNPQSTCSPEELPGGITISGNTMTGSGACSSGPITLSPSAGIEAGGTITCNLTDDTCNGGGTLTFTGGGSSLIISGSASATASISEVYSYYPVYTQPENTCGNTSGCTLESEQVCDQNDQNCQYMIEQGSSVATAPDITWTESQTDQNLNPPSPSITWTVSMNGSSVQVTPSETVDTTGYSGNLATSSNNSLYPTVNEIWNCQSSSPYNFDTMNKQQTAVTGSASMNSNNTAFSYTGVNGNQHNNISIYNTVNNATQQECVVQQTTTNTSITSSVTATTATQNTPTAANTTDTETLNCTNTGTVNNPVWNCPIPTGYTIQTDCTDASNINNANFAPAMVELQVLDKAGSSLICSAN